MSSWWSGSDHHSPDGEGVDLPPVAASEGMLCGVCLCGSWSLSSVLLLMWGGRVPGDDTDETDDDDDDKVDDGSDDEEEVVFVIKMGTPLTMAAVCTKRQTTDAASPDNSSITLTCTGCPGCVRPQGAIVRL